MDKHLNYEQIIKYCEYISNTSTNKNPQEKAENEWESLFATSHRLSCSRCNNLIEEAYLREFYKNGAEASDERSFKEYYDDFIKNEDGCKEYQEDYSGDVNSKVK